MRISHYVDTVESAEFCPDCAFAKYDGQIFPHVDQPADAQPVPVYDHEESPDRDVVCDTCHIVISERTEMPPVKRTRLR